MGFRCRLPSEKDLLSGRSVGSDDAVSVPCWQGRTYCSGSTGALPPPSNGRQNKNRGYI
jgi:hypothetical protein